MIEAVLLGAAAQSSLILSGLVVYGVEVPTKVIGALAGFGAGALVAAIAFDLIPESESLEHAELALWLLLGAAVFVISDRVVKARFGGEQRSGPAPMGIGIRSSRSRGGGFDRSDRPASLEEEVLCPITSSARSFRSRIAHTSA